MKPALFSIVPFSCKRVFFTEQTKRIVGSTDFFCLSLWGRLPLAGDLFCGSSPLGSSVYSTVFLNDLIFSCHSIRGNSVIVGK